MSSVENTTFQMCSSSYGGAVYSKNISMEFISCKFLNNKADLNNGNDIYCSIDGEALKGVYDANFFFLFIFSIYAFIFILFIFFINFPRSLIVVLQVFQFAFMFPVPPSQALRTSLIVC
jgi:hypothetical protein